MAPYKVLDLLNRFHDRSQIILVKDKCMDHEHKSSTAVRKVSQIFLNSQKILVLLNFTSFLSCLTCS